MRRAPFSLTSILVSGALALSALGFSQNTIIIGNLAGSNDGTSTLISNGWQKAMGFTMGAFDYDLVDIQLRVEYFGLPVIGLLDVSLHANAANNQIGSKLMAFETKAATAKSDITTITLEPETLPFKKFRLRANQSYWIVVRTHGSSSAFWWASVPSVQPTGVATHLGSLINGGAGLPTNSSALQNTYELRGIQRPATAWYLQDPATGQIGVASYRSFNFTNWATFPQVVGSAWEVLSFGQYGNTFHADAFLRNKSTGKLAFWFANSTNFFQFVEIPQTPPSVWKFHGTTRFGGSSVEYPVFQNPQSGVVVIGVHNENQITQWRIFPKVPNLAWEIVAVGDTDGDDVGDIMFRNKSTGQIAVWRTDGHDFTTWHVFPQVPSSAWDIIDIIGYPETLRGVIFRNKTTKEYAVWRINPAGTAFTNWMPLRPQPDPRFNFKGYGFIESDF